MICCVTVHVDIGQTVKIDSAGLDAVVPVSVITICERCAGAPD
jgi:hypothetical protein